MSFSLKWGDDNVEDGGMVYFDAVTTYQQNYSGQVTSHPVDSLGNISDHFVKNNSKFTLSAVITGVDISTASYLIQDNAGNSPFNVRSAPNAVSVSSTDDSILNQFIPDVIGQFLPFNSPSVQMDGRRAELLGQTQELLTNLVSGVKFNESTGQFDSNIQTVQLYEFSGTFLKRIVNNLVLTNISFREDPNTGEALYCDLSLEQVTFAFLKKTEIPQDVQDSIKKKSASKSSKGKVDSTPKDANNPNNKDSQKTKNTVNKSIADVDPLRAEVD